MSIIINNYVKIRYFEMRFVLLQAYQALSTKINSWSTLTSNAEELPQESLVLLKVFITAVDYYLNISRAHE